MGSYESKRMSEIRDQLKYAWIPLFSRFGNLTEIQVKSIPLILEGKNVIVSSPTATGKTEAVIAPVIERLKREKWEGLSVLYIVPTRALANDIYYRLEGQLRDLNLKCEYKHGDKPNISYNNIPNLLITTPESLDSLICRHSDIISGLRALIIDEIHFVDNTYRGDQLRVLINRLRKISKNKFNICLLSATIADPYEVGKRYIEDFEIVKSSKSRSIEYYISSNLEEFLKLAREKNWKKLLVFCNYRETTEESKVKFEKNWGTYPIIVHHGKLDRVFRKEAEEVLKYSRSSICISTSTLEVGIDVGNVDCVVIYEIPWSIFSLAQRVGRGNRRGDIIYSTGIAKSEIEAEHLKEMYELLKSGYLPKEEYSPDYSVIIQQIFSCLYQYRRGMAKDEIFELVKPLCDEEILDLIVDYLVERELIYPDTGKFLLSTKIRNMGELGKIHSNIPDTVEYTVLDISSGKAIGKISGFFDKTFALGGSVWKIISVKEGKKEIIVKRSKEEFSMPIFERAIRPGAFYKYLPPELRSKNSVFKI